MTGHNRLTFMTIQNPEYHHQQENKNIGSGKKKIISIKIEPKTKKVKDHKT